MTTQSWNTRVRHDSDALFREWGSEFSTKLAAAGLVQTADTGQINWTTVVRGSNSTDAGYEVWRMNDTAQATAPVFFKIYYGTESTNCPRIRVAVGIASNGSGTVTTIGGGAAAINGTQGSISAQTSDSLRNSYLCVAEGFVGWNWKQNSGNQTESIFLFCRSCDADGTPNTQGAIQATGTISGTAFCNTQCMRFAATAALYTQRTTQTESMMTFFPQKGANGSTLVGSDFQAAVGWMCTPRVGPTFGICGVLDTEVTTGNTLSVALVGSTARTYIALSAVYSMGPGSISNGHPKFAMLWE